MIRNVRLEVRRIEGGQVTLDVIGIRADGTTTALTVGPVCLAEGDELMIGPGDDGLVVH